MVAKWLIQHGAFVHYLKNYWELRLCIEMQIPILVLFLGKKIILNIPHFIFFPCKYNLL